MEPSPPRPRPAPPPAFPPELGSVLTDYHAPRRERYGLHLALFLATLVSTVWAGGILVGRSALYTAGSVWGLLLDPAFLADGLWYALPLLFFLTTHEFGHYFAARWHRTDVSLPYYIPVPLVGLPVFNLGTFGAVIRIREPLRRTNQLFDVGAAGPLAGFVVALGVLAYALWTLPPPEYLFAVEGHEPLLEYIRQTGGFPETPFPDTSGLGRLTLGQTPLFWLLTQAVPDMPPMYELYHYPVLFAGWLALFFTALNLLPVGQLDGGHVTYALFGPKWHARIARAFVLLLMYSAAVGLVLDTQPGLVAEAAARGWAPWAAGAGVWVVLAVGLYLLLRRVYDRAPRHRPAALLGLLAAVAATLAVPALADAVGYSGWFIWTLLIVLLIKVDHPPVLRPERLTPGRRALAWLCVAIFVLCFSFKPIYIAF